MMECSVPKQPKGVLHYHILGPKGFEECHRIDYLGPEPTPEELKIFLHIICQFHASQTGLPASSFVPIRELIL